jgi:hypothetical protein
MTMIDKAAAAFREADARVTVDRTDKLAHFNVTEALVLPTAMGKTDTAQLPWVQHAKGIRHDKAVVMRDQIGGRNGVEAVLQEMISVKVLTIALINCGAPIPAARGLAEKLLPAIILLLQSDAEGGGDQIVIHG